MDSNTGMINVSTIKHFIMSENLKRTLAKQPSIYTHLSVENIDQLCKFVKFKIMTSPGEISFAQFVNELDEKIYTSLNFFQRILVDRKTLKKSIEYISIIIIEEAEAYYNKLPKTKQLASKAKKNETKAKKAKHRRKRGKVIRDKLKEALCYDFLNDCRTISVSSNSDDNISEKPNGKYFTTLH